METYLERCLELVARAEARLAEIGAEAREIAEIEGYIAHARRQIDQFDRRLLKGETIPQEEKAFSIFEPHTRWISKDKAGCPAEFGVPVCILEDRHGFILHHEIMWEGGDTDHAVPMVEGAWARFPDLRAASFDRGFHSPANRVCLDELLDSNMLPKKGYLKAAEREREQGGEFAAMRRRHPAVESATDNLGHCGLDRVLACGPEGFARMVALSVAAFNIHRIGLLLRRKAARRRRAAWRRSPTRPDRSRPAAGGRTARAPPAAWVAESGPEAWKTAVRDVRTARSGADCCTAASGFVGIRNWQPPGNTGFLADTN